MRKILLILLITLTCGPLCALPLGNPSEASLFRHGLFWGCNEPYNCWLDSFSVRIGYYGDFVFNRNLKIRGRSFGTSKNTHKTTINTNAGYLALNLCDKIDLFGTLGATNLVIEATEATFRPIDPSVDGGRTLWTNTQFSWSIGARASVLQWSCFTLGAEVQHFEAYPDISMFTADLGGRENFFNNQNEAKYYETQLGLGVSYAFVICDSKLSMVPYVGGKWARGTFTADNMRFIELEGNSLVAIADMETTKRWGYAVGVSLLLCDVIGVTAEGRFADETAFYVNGQFRF